MRALRVAWSGIAWPLPPHLDPGPWVPVQDPAPPLDLCGICPAPEWRPGRPGAQRLLAVEHQVQIPAISFEQIPDFAPPVSAIVERLLGLSIHCYSRQIPTRCTIVNNEYV